MTITNKAAEKGQQFLLDNHEKYILNVEYDFDGERIFIQLNNKVNGDCTVFDGSDIFRQVYEFISTTQVKHYRLSMNGEDFKGTAEDIARWYCKHQNIKLFIEPDAKGKDDSTILWAHFQDAEEGTLIAYFENCSKDIETAYRLFFYEYMLQVDDPDFCIADLS